jgi:hypothetical protein
MAAADGTFFLGDYVDAEGGRTSPVSYEASDLTTHGVIVGMTGSGKTGLAVVLIEEALRSGIPVLVLDPKGDMPNLKLNFPSLDAAAFQPWVNEADATREDIAVDQLAEDQAELWRTGLAGWGLGRPDLEALHGAAPTAVYTPGSTAGLPLNIVGDLAPPPAGSDPETVAAEAATFVTGLLGLVGIDADPLSSREHVLLTNLVERAWSEGRALDLATLITQTLDPPFRKLGVFEVDSFFPAADRRDLAMRLNALVASPTFGAWMEGAPIDVQSLLYRPDGGPRASILYLAHLSEAERQFVVALVLSKVVTWMRAQSGTTELRALLYMDEVFGFAPPTANPPAKGPILTLLKQARAYGVGFVLSTQNPVDLDYKAMSNAGTWMIGRLQTERDKARVLEALSSASGEVDVSMLDAQIAGLGKRQFVLHNTHDRGGPKLFTTRWAMSYLRGPLTRDQIRVLTEPDRAALATADAPSAAPPTAPPAAAELDEHESPVAPAAPRGVPVYYLDPAAPWAAEVGATATGKKLAPAVVARVHLRFDDRAAGVGHQEEWEAVLYPLARQPEVADARNVDYDPRDLRPSPPEGATYRLTDAPIGEAAFFKNLASGLKDSLHRDRRVEVFRNAELKLYSRVGETEVAFLERCDAAAREAADRDAVKVRERFEAKMARVRTAIERAEDRVDQLDVDTKTRRSHELIAGIGDVIGAFFGGKRNTRSITTAAKGASSRRATSSRTAQRLRTAEDRVEEAAEDLEELEQDLLDELAELNDVWEEKAKQIEGVEIGLEQTDVTVDEVALLWVPTE